MWRQGRQMKLLRSMRRLKTVTTVSTANFLLAHGMLEEKRVSLQSLINDPHASHPCSLKKRKDDVIEEE